MRLFELKYNGETEWIAATTNIHALKVWSALTDNGISELDNEDEIREIPVEDWPTLTIGNQEYDSEDPNDWETKTLAEYMATEVTEAVVIGGSMYE